MLRLQTIVQNRDHNSFPGVASAPCGLNVHVGQAVLTTTLQQNKELITGELHTFAAVHLIHVYYMSIVFHIHLLNQWVSQ